MGDLGVAETLVARELKDFTAARRQFIHRTLECELDLAFDQASIFRRSDRFLTLEHGHGALLHFLMAKMIEGAIAGRTKEIGTQRELRREFVPAAPQTEHDVLHDFLAVRAVVQHGLGKAHEAAVPIAKNRVEGGAIIASEPLDQAGINGAGQGRIQFTGLY